MRQIAISYRRDDSEAITGRLFDRLSAHFGREAVFRDIDGISAGTDFRLQVGDALKTCRVLIAVIGRAWRGPNRGGQARIHEETDPVRIELEIALRQGIAIIPLLIGATKMPSPGQIPDSLQSVVFRHACRVDPGEDFDHHADRLIREVERALAGAAGPATPAGPPREAVADPPSPPVPPPRPPAPRPSRYDISLDEHDVPTVRSTAPAQWGGYAQSSLSHYPGTYLVVRPAFKTRENIYTYLVDIAWDDVGGGLVFEERSRSDVRHTQHGRIWIPNPSHYLYLVSGRDGWLRSITLSFLDEDNEMRGIVSTLHNIGGAVYVPVAAPIVFMKRDEHDGDALGELTPSDALHPRYLAILRRAVAAGAAQLITV